MIIYKHIISSKTSTTNNLVCYYHCLSLHFFPGEPGLAGCYWSKGWWRWWLQLDYWSCKSCKTPVKSSSPTNQPAVFLQTGCPSCHPTNSVKALKVKISHSMDLLTPNSPGGLPTFIFDHLIAPGCLGEGCHASHQPSDASTPLMLFLSNVKFCQWWRKTNCAEMNYCNKNRTALIQDDDPHSRTCTPKPVYKYVFSIYRPDALADAKSTAAYHWRHHSNN